MDATYYFVRCFVVLLYLDLIVAMSLEVVLRRAASRCDRRVASCSVVLSCIVLRFVFLCCVVVFG